MIVMPANNTGVRTGYLAGRFPGKIGLLFSPGGQRGPFDFLPYAIDNGVYGKGEAWEEGPFFDLLDWAKLSGQNPRWVIVPDVVADRIRTLRRWDLYAERVAKYGWPLAFAVQDGMDVSDVPKDADVVFVGGGTEWKWNTIRMWCSEFPRAHVGRVNGYRGLWVCHDSGAESCDGTGWTRGDQRQYRGLLAYLEESTGKRERITQSKLELVG
jgi:hypothetical protein